MALEVETFNKMRKPMRRVGQCLVVAMAVAVCLASQASADWSGRSHSMKITFQGYTQTTPLTNFPVLVRLREKILGFRYTQFQSSGCNELRFSDGTQTEELYYEVEEWNPSGTSYIWVRVPRLASSNDYIWAYWGKSGETAPAYTTNGLTWDSHYKGVWHMSETNAQDSSQYGNHGTSYGNEDTTGVVDGGQEFDVDPWDYVDAGTNSSLNITGDITLEAWMVNALAAISDPDASGNFFLSRQGGLSWPDQFSAYALQWSQIGQGKLNFYTDGIGAWVNSTTVINDGNPHHVAVTGAGSSGQFYVDAAGAGAFTYSSPSSDAVAGTNVSMTLGDNSGWGNNTCVWKGMLDEIRISDIARHPDWIWATYKTAGAAAFAKYQMLSAPGFAYRMKISFPGYEKTTQLSEFPVLVKFSESIPGFRYAQFLSGQHDDLRFSDGDMTEELYYEVEEWDPSGTSCVWVCMSELASSNDYIWAYWGRGGQTAPAYTTNGLTWDSHYKGVWHLSEPDAQDSSRYGNHGTGYGNTNTTGIVNGGQEFDVDPWDYIDAGTNSSLNITGDITLEAWMVNAVAAISDPDASGNFFLSRQGGLSWPAQWTAYALQWSQVGQGKLNFYTDGIGAWVNSTTVISDGNRHHVAVTGAGSSGQFYVDAAGAGAFTYSPASSDAVAGTNVSMTLGDNSGWFNNTCVWKGMLDEIRVSDIARPPDWIWATWKNAIDFSNFVLFGEVEATPGMTFVIR